MHVDGRVNPVEDVATINFELALSDLLQVEKRLERVRKGKAKVWNSIPYFWNMHVLIIKSGLFGKRERSYRT
jgi:hypothetical protein